MGGRTLVSYEEIWYNAREGLCKVIEGLGEVSHRSSNVRILDC